MEEVVAAILLGLLAGVMAGFFGVGGGLLFVPALVLVFELGQLEAQATSLAAILPTVVAGAWRQQRYGNVDWRTAAILGGVAVLGVEVGARLATALDEDVLRRLFALLVFAVAAQLALRALRS
ncbi:MAG TPA: sulfite exporter TauE/SafE family protein [Gaiellaceae bacterium]|jgi:hypothetical protein